MQYRPFLNFEPPAQTQKRFKLMRVAFVPIARPLYVRLTWFMGRILALLCLGYIGTRQTCPRYLVCSQKMESKFVKQYFGFVMTEAC